MGKYAAILIPVLLGILLVRILAVPMRKTCRLTLHSGGGLLCLWLLNTVSGVTGILLPINAVTVVLAGTLGLPAIGLIVLLETI